MGLRTIQLAKHQGDLAQRDAELGDVGPVDQHAVGLQEQPVVEVNGPGVVPDLEGEAIGPVEGVAVGAALGNADDAVRPAPVGVLVQFLDAPDPPLGLAVVVGKVLDQGQGRPVPGAFDIDLELAAKLA